MLKDSAQRLQATDPRRSFIVQAPAGSGKTELLTQRFLRLLSLVHAPEQIVALTFTRKAASEMRERILSALKHAERGLETTSEHQRLTNSYALEALKRSDALGWKLLKQPSRLKIITIDSLCQTLTQSIPLPEQQIPYAQITDSSSVLYQRAVRACLKDSLAQAELQPVIQQLLKHLDNRQDKLFELLSELLGTREQWLSILLLARNQNREICEQALASIERHELQGFLDSVPLPLRSQLQQISCQVAQIENNPQSPRYPLVFWKDFEQFNRDTASALAALLLTSDNKLRKGVDHYVGLLKGSCSNEQYGFLKSTSKELFSQLNEQADFFEALMRVKNLPPPCYDDQQWDVLQALLTLLPILAAHLHLVFRETNEVDFTAISQQALFALGDEDNPTDLTLHLDNSIHHLLVDEFQDTSIQQFQLITKLIQGWLPDDGKTLFVVGDPMQSIYRFRQAEVGLFLKAKQQGIGSLKLTPLELSCNFRSSDTIVHWVNTQFHTIFPKQDDMELGAVSFHPSVAIQSDTEGSRIDTRQFANKDEEAKALVAIAAEELRANPSQTVAILVRSRSHLSHLVPLLREHGIPFQGVEIEKLSSLSHLRDIFSLTKALLMPASRLHWLAFLRSPWCGLTLEDLHCLANFDPKKSLFHALSQSDQISGLSNQGKLRAQFIYQVMNSALASRYQQSLTDWIVQTIKQLHSEQILDHIQLADLEQFWLLLIRFTTQGQTLDLELFEMEFEQLYSQRINPSRLQIMTIHKSKGLEFDCVILPGLGSRKPKQEKPLLRWLTLPGLEDEELMLLSPIRAAHEKQSLLYDYLGNIAAAKERYEQQRLLYVAVTRAKKRLYLVDCHDKASKGTFRELLQHLTFTEQEELTPNNDTTIDPEASALPILKRLPIEFYTTVDHHPAEATNPSPIAMSNNARHIGIVAHELLQWICDKHPNSVDDLPWNILANRFKSLGFDTSEQQQALELIREQIQSMFQDPIGQWLCQKHDREHNEYALLVKEQDRVTTNVIDRTFYDKGVLWIIDFKTGNDNELTQLKHRKQVNHYAKLLFNPDQPPPHCGIYYLASNRWVPWIYEHSQLIFS
jgi:ATP-dependent exoDNAse (exonuclease V) beta subunit